MSTGSNESNRLTVLDDLSAKSLASWALLKMVLLLLVDIATAWVGVLVANIAESLGGHSVRLGFT